MADSLFYGWRAEEDLAAIYRSLSAVGPLRAREFLRSIEDRCESLLLFPEQGKARDDLLAGIRTVAYARSVVIAYRVLGDGIRVERVFFGGQDCERLLRAGE